MVEIFRRHWTQTFMLLFPVFVFGIILKLHCVRRGTKGDTTNSVNLKKIQVGILKTDWSSLINLINRRAIRLKYFLFPVIMYNTEISIMCWKKYTCDSVNLNKIKIKLIFCFSQFHYQCIIYIFMQFKCLKKPKLKNFLCVPIPAYNTLRCGN